jgi:C-terminal processing protease CtpA/Prc
MARDRARSSGLGMTRLPASAVAESRGGEDCHERVSLSFGVSREVSPLSTQIEVEATCREKPYGVVSSDADRHTVIGSRILENFAVTLDQKNSRVRFDREDASPIVPPPYRLVGFRLQREEEGFVVWGVMAGSPAQRAGIKNGDTLVTINDKPVAEVYGLPAWDQLLQNDTLEIRYKPAGESNHRRVSLKVWELLP